MPSATRRTAALTLAGLAIAGAVGVAGCGSDSDSTAKPESRQVTVVGTGKVQGTPDTLNVTASIEATAPDVTAAMNQTSSRQQAVLDALSGAGIDKKDIATKQVELQPDYRDSVITGYRASNTIDIKVRKLDTASQVLAKIVEAGGNSTRISNVAYSIDDDSQLVKDARTRAFNDAKDRAQQYAQLSGLNLGKVVSISEATGGTTPTPMPAPRMAMAEAVPLSPGQQTVNFSVTVIWDLG
ncbi:SIMPL domain-containing protein [Mycolicibacterium sp. HS_4_1]